MGSPASPVRKALFRLSAANVQPNRPGARSSQFGKIREFLLRRCICSRDIL